MKKPMGVLTQQSIDFASDAFFALLKMLVLVLVLLVGGLLAAQSSFTPVSLRLLSSYGMEYASRTFKPYRQWFPEPQLVQSETK